MAPVLLLFVDGIGLAPAGEANPFATTPSPGFERLLGGPLTSERVEDAGDRGTFVLRAIDACLGVPGLPQSGTGQTALFTGVNAPLLVGRHVVAFPGPRLKRVLADHGLFRRARDRGLRCAFANAFSPRYDELVKRRRLRKSASVVLAESAGLRLRDLTDLESGNALTWDIERDLFTRPGDRRVARVAAEEAGRHLAAIASGHDLTLYETFLTDLAGHRRGPIDATEAARRVDALVSGLLEAAVPDRLTVVLTSDHGNLEESDHRRHTRNPVPLLAWGPDAAALRHARSLTDLASVLLDVGGGVGSPRVEPRPGLAGNGTRSQGADQGSWRLPSSWGRRRRSTQDVVVGSDGSP